MSLEQLKKTGSFGISVKIGSAIIVHDFGDGYDASLRTGRKEGQLSYALKYNVLPDAESHRVVNMLAESRTQADYLWDFYLRHAVADYLPFVILCPRTKQLVMVKFADPELSMELFAAALYSTGVALRQFRQPGIQLPGSQISLPNPFQI